MKALVLSGGGSKGAYVGGMLEYMKMEMGKEYELYLGTSTGSLLQTLASVNDFESLKEGYTTMGLDDIYKISPLKKNGKFNLWSIFRMIVFRKEPTFGDSSNLKDLIYRFFPQEKYNQSLAEGKNIVTCVTNLSRARSEYYSSVALGEEGYDKFVDWTWISGNAVPFTSLVRRGVEDDYYADGGFMEHVPIRKAIEMGATEIDVISTKTENYSGDVDVDFGNNPLELIERMFDVFLRENADRDIEAAKNIAKENDVTVNIYFLPKSLTDNTMFFDEKQMRGWWDEGYNYIKKLDEQKDLKKACKVIKMRAKKKPTRK